MLKWKVPACDCCKKIFAHLNCTVSKTFETYTILLSSVPLENERTAT